MFQDEQVNINTLLETVRTGADIRKKQGLKQRQLVIKRIKSTTPQDSMRYGSISNTLVLKLKWK